MKRIVILCDGTWNRADAETPTNVVKLAQALRPIDPVGIVQIPIYIPGVGTGDGVTMMSRLLDKTLGGAFGRGLLENIVEAYRHIVFLYEPGDEVFIFGFSRGAYTARSLTGFLRSSGIVSRDALHKIPHAVKRYRTLGNKTFHPGTDDSHAFRARDLQSHVATSRKEQQWRKENGLEPGHLFQIAFLGVWDSVGALGVPAQIPILGPMTQKKYRFHDASLSSIAQSARHAVAIDEHRASFLPTNWDNVDDLNAESGRDDRPYREEYFAGDHGSVGGGGDILGLSSIALDWIMQGAIDAGLSFSARHMAENAKHFDPDAPLRNMTRPQSGLMDTLMRRNRIDRKGPSRIENVNDYALRRWVKEIKSPGFKPYRPKTLAHLQNDIVAWHAQQTGQDKGDTRLA